MVPLKCMLLVIKNKFWYICRRNFSNNERLLRGQKFVIDNKDFSDLIQQLGLLHIKLGDILDNVNICFSMQVTNKILNRINSMLLKKKSI